jgi:hypothetical protein
MGSAAEKESIEEFPALLLYVCPERLWAMPLALNRSSVKMKSRIFFMVFIFAVGYLFDCKFIDRIEFLTIVY